jgi:RNA polymerase sigma-70 factor, ECF subfamily
LEEIAEIMDENINTVKTRLYRGLKLLRIIITEEELI